MSCTIPQYCYSPLSQALGSIRLLRLVANENDRADVRCELFEYRLQESDKATFPYEALSYTWGDPDKRQSIFIGGHSFNVTTNLYAALLRLRDRYITRIIWVDAVCINQADDEEKAQQIQFMAKIYAKASRVIVWLGETADNSDRALESIRATAGHGNYLDDVTARDGIIALLQRQWFRRIWILQEVAAARSILISCGPTEIDGYAFCLGLNLVGFYDTHKDLHAPVHPVTSLISGAIFRPKYVTSRSGRASLDICSLGELIDKYHAHEATKHHDKVYALLGMSSDNLSEANLLPNYRIPWKILLQRLVKFILGKRVSIKTWNDKEVAEIRSRGSVLAQVSAIEIDKNGGQNMHITVKNKSYQISNTEMDDLWKDGGYGRFHKQEIYGIHDAEWILQSSAKLVQKGDIVCLLQGAPKPMIIRPYKDHFSVIKIAVTPPENIRIVSFPRNFLLIWDWDYSPGRSQYRAEVQEHSQRTLGVKEGRATRLWDFALILKDLEEHEEAKEKLLEAIECDGVALREEDEIRITEAVMTEIARRFDKEVIMLLLKRKKDDIQVTERLVVEIARRFDTEVMVFLLDRKWNEIQLTEGVIRAAAQNWTSGDEVMMLLLNRKLDEIRITERLVAKIAAWFNEKVMALLLDQKGDEIQITEDVLDSATWNSTSRNQVMSLLLNRKGHEIQVTEELVLKIARNLSEEVMALLLDRKGDEIHITQEVLEEAAWNQSSGKEVITLLLDRKGDQIQITEGILQVAAKNWKNGKEIVELLLKRKEDAI